MAHPPTPLSLDLNIISQQQELEAIKLTQSGTYSVGSFKINHAGYSFSDVEHTPRSERSNSILSNRSNGEASDIMEWESVCLEDCEDICPIGQGASGVVKKVLHRPSRTMLAKKVVPLDLSEKKSRQIITELRTLHQSASDNIVSFYGAFYKEGAVSVLLEYMDAGSLSDCLKLMRAIPERFIAKIAQQVMRGLCYLHVERRIIHRDIKPSNILLSRDGSVKIADFGVSGELSGSIDGKVSFVGTVTYMSPERIQGRSHTFNSDIWSLGLSLMECALGRFPYSTQAKSQGKNRKGSFGFWDIMDNIVSSPPPVLSEKFSEPCRSFISSCLKMNPDDRPSASELLQHPFIKMHDQPKNDLKPLIQAYMTKQEATRSHSRRQTDPPRRQPDHPEANLRQLVGTKRAKIDSIGGSVAMNRNIGFSSNSPIISRANRHRSPFNDRSVSPLIKSSNTSGFHCALSSKNGKGLSSIVNKQISKTDEDKMSSTALSPKITDMSL